MKKSLIVFASIFFIFTIYSVSAISWSGGGSNISTFLELTDTPATYSGQAGLVATVNPGETALIFSAGGGGGGGITNISQAGDVNETGVQDDDVLRWNDALKMWVDSGIEFLVAFGDNWNYWDSGEIFFNETKLNETGDDRWIQKAGDEFSAQETQFNFSYVQPGHGPGQGLAQFVLKSNESDAGMTLRIENDAGVGMVLFSGGSDRIGSLETGNFSGLGADGTDIHFILQEENKSFIFQQFNGTALVDSMILQEDGNLFLKNDLILEDENKRIMTVQVDGGNAMVFVDFDSLDAGGFPFVYIANDSEGDAIITGWQQNGNNNSFSGTMNSVGTFSKEYLQWTEDQTAFFINTDNVTLLFQVSNYLNYCDFLQSNLSLVPEGCQFFADTEGRGVPLTFTGDLEVHRAAVIHEGLEVFDNFDYITRQGSDFDIFNGSIHNLIPVAFESGFIEGDAFTITSNNFIGGINPFVNDPTNIIDWITTTNTLCDVDRCALAQGNGGPVIMSMTFDTSDTNETYVNFVYSLFNLVGSDELTVVINNNTGSGDVEIFSDDGTEDKLSANILLPEAFWNNTQINMTVTCDASNLARFCYFDTLIVNGTITVNSNQTVNAFDSELCMGDGVRDVNGECNRGIYYRAENDTIECKGTCVGFGGGGGGGGITGSGTAGNIMKWASTTSATNSIMSETSGIITLAGSLVVNNMINGSFNWTVLNNWLSFDGSTLSFNDTRLNESIIEVASIFNNTDLIDTEIAERIGNDTLLQDQIDLRINISDEGNLNVNSSVWWAEVSGWVNNWFIQSGDDLDFNETKLNNSILDVASVYNETDLIPWIEIGSNITLKNLTKEVVIGNLTIDNRITARVNGSSIIMHNFGQLEYRGVIG